MYTHDRNIGKPNNLKVFGEQVNQRVLTEKSNLYKKKIQKKLSEFPQQTEIFILCNVTHICGTELKSRLFSSSFYLLLYIRVPDKGYSNLLGYI
jgi:hypothetical protein